LSVSFLAALTWNLDIIIIIIIIINMMRCSDDAAVITVSCDDVITGEVD